MYAPHAVESLESSAAARAIRRTRDTPFQPTMQDMEGIGGPPLGPTQERAAITYAVCALKRELNKTVPGNYQAWTTDTGAYFDYATMTAQGCIDIW
jgi:hypothetical protein